ncbi:TA system VapC family ribonuclease toxin [Synechococcus sp. CS-1328]|uniref:TA system VapC family ribonuclease toxin n=1 Tax=Synechococcus sp. CS-1328 TaxID=2847976 RepID=UPI00223B6B06|nr:TA system VapC family ribonuclease toxin [Synechococcus sp. CS-1328]MCT0225517.1 PIN domain-containing protein [Synechococcus sp. CS-1328]
MPACLLDSNVWLAAAFSEHPAHALAGGVLRSASAVEPALWCRATQQSFLRLASTPAITQAYGVPKATNGDAWAALQTFLALPQVDVIDEPPDLGRIWCQLGAIEQTAPKRWMDAYMVAFAIAARVSLISLDQDFRQFEPEGLTFQLLHADVRGEDSP